MMFVKQMRIRSPPTKRRSTFPPRDLMTDHSHSASDEDQIYGTTGMDPAGDWPMLQDDLVDGRAVSDGSRFRPGSGELEMIQPVSRRHQARSRQWILLISISLLMMHVRVLPHRLGVSLSHFASPPMSLDKAVVVFKPQHGRVFACVAAIRFIFLVDRPAILHFSSRTCSQSRPFPADPRSCSPV